MSCRRYQRALSAHLDDALSAREEATLLDHAVQCHGCAALLARYRQMDVFLRRLPSTTPSAGIRQAVLDKPSQAFGFCQLIPVRASAVLLTVLAVGVGLLLARPDVANVPQVFVHRLQAQEPLSVNNDMLALGSAADPDDRRSAAGQGGTSITADDARVLTEVRGTVNRPGFRPLMPAYLPRGARLNTVDFGRAGPNEPIDRLEVGFAAGEEQIRLRQLGGRQAAFEQQRLETQHIGQVKRVVLGGREWLFFTRPDSASGAHLFILVGERDGLIILLESSLPMEELTKMAVSLSD